MMARQRKLECPMIISHPAADAQWVQICSRGRSLGVHVVSCEQARLEASILSMTLDSVQEQM